MSQSVPFTIQQFRKTICKFVLVWVAGPHLVFVTLDPSLRPGNARAWKAHSHKHTHRQRRYDHRTVTEQKLSADILNEIKHI